VTLRRRQVVDPAGVAWTVGRRWWTWRRALSVREMAAMIRDQNPQPGAVAEPFRPTNALLKMLLALVQSIVWLVVTAGKVFLIACVAAVFLVLSLLDLIGQLIALPVVLVARKLRLARWPVQINRRGRFHSAEYIYGFGPAADLRDGVIARIARGDRGSTA
jgi:hypothetical protein